MTGRKYHYFLCLSWPSLRIAPHRLNLETIGQSFFDCLSVDSLMWLAGFADSRGKVKNALYYEIFKEQRLSFLIRKTGKG